MDLIPKMFRYILSAPELEYLAHTCAFLKPFADLTTWISSETCPSAGFTFAIYEFLMDQLEGMKHCELFFTLQRYIIDFGNA